MQALADSSIDWLQHLVIAAEKFWFADARGEVMAPLLSLI